MKAVTFLFIAALFVSYQARIWASEQDHLKLLEGTFRIVDEQLTESVNNGNWAKTQKLISALSSQLDVDLLLSLEGGQVIGKSRTYLKTVSESGSTFYSDLFATDIRSIKRELKSDPPATVTIIQPASKYPPLNSAVIFSALLPYFAAALALSLFFSYRENKKLISKMKSVVGPTNQKTPLRVLESFEREYERRLLTANKALKQQAAILTSMNEGVLAVSEEGRVITINPMGADLFRINNEDVVGKLVEESIPNFEFQTLIKNVLSNGIATTKDLEVNDRVINTRVSRILGAPGVLAVYSDVTKVRQLDDFRKEFISNVSHELKTPVTAIRGFCETLLEDSHGSTLKHLKIIFEHSERLQAIIEDLLKLARLEGGESVQLVSQPLEPIVKEVIGLFQPKATERQIALGMKLEPEIKISADKSLLKQALYNLTENSLKYTPNGGSILISARVFEKEVLISVIDNGAGIPAEHLPRVFERFYVVDKARTRQSGGTGLGLSIVKHISLALRGHVTVSSELNKGSTFTIHLPADPL